MLQFDDFGYITPYEVHPLLLDEFERTFVIDSERERLFQRLLDLVADLKGLGATDFYLWVDGSFVTKKRVPRDIDVVFFIDYQKFETVSQHLRSLRTRYENDIDFFLSPDFPVFHPGFSDTVLRKFNWMQTFSHDRQGRKKGLLEISI